MPSLNDNPPRMRSERIYDRLRRQILAGAYAPGDALPSERSLSDAHRVNRHAVREAIKRLQQTGLVEVTTGGAARVRDWRSSGGLDLLSDLAGADPVSPMRQSVAELRATVGADAARLCAERAPDELRDEIRELAGELREPADMRRFQDRFAAYARLWDRIVDGSGNLAYRLALNTLVGARTDGGLDPRAFQDEVDDPAPVRALADAIERRDATAAERLARELLQRSASVAA